MLTFGRPITGPAVRAHGSGPGIPVTVVGGLFQVYELGGFRFLHRRRTRSRHRRRRRPGRPEPEPQPTGRPFARRPLVTGPCHRGRGHAARLPVLAHQRFADFPEVRQTVPARLHRTAPGHTVTLAVGVQQHLDDLQVE